MVAPPVSAAAAAHEKTILVIGMHRSGTSMLTRLIHSMGANAGKPEDLIPEDPHDSPSGYWERKDVVFEHDSLLVSHGFAWDWLAHFEWQRLNPVYVDAFVDRAAPWRRGLDTAGRPLVLKDPRLCLFMPIWQAVLRNPAYVFCVRDPRTIATSIATPPRRKYPAPFALALWEKYVQQALNALRGERVLFVRYEALMTNPLSECVRLASGVERLGVSGLRALTETHLDTLVDTRFNRSKASQQATMSPAQGALLGWLDEQCREPEPVQVSRLPPFESPDAMLGLYQGLLREKLLRQRADAARNYATMGGEFFSMQARSSR